MQQWNTPEDAVLINPPIQAMPLEETPSKWPVVVGVISLIYAIGGMLCWIGYSASTFFMEALMKMGGMDMKPEPIVKIIAIGSAMLLFVLGIIMMAGSIKLIRRKVGGVKLLKLWAVLRVALIVIALGASMFTAPAMIRFTRAIAEAQNEALRKAGRPEQPIPSDQDIWRKNMVQAGVFSALFAVYPVFIVFYLSRRKITDEVRNWRP